VNSNLKDIFLLLVKKGISYADSSSLSGNAEIQPLSVEDWQSLEEMANEQGLLGVMLDGVETLPRELRPEKKAIIQSIGQVLQAEQQLRYRNTQQRRWPFCCISMESEHMC